MKNKSKFILMITSIIIILSLGYNVYQKNRINNFEKELLFNVRNNLQRFASYGGNIESQSVYAEQYASIVTAQESYILLRNSNEIDSDEWEYSLQGLFIVIKDTMLNDKEKFKEVFDEADVSKLIFKISDNFEDKYSINKVYKLLSN